MNPYAQLDAKIKEESRFAYSAPSEPMDQADLQVPSADQPAPSSAQPDSSPAPHDQQPTPTKAPDVTQSPGAADGNNGATSMQVALMEAKKNLSYEQHSTLWAQMTRRYTGRSAPPLLKERWEKLGTCKAKKNECFDVFLACGGEVGKMEAVEQIRRTDIDEDESGDEFCTRAQLLGRFAEEEADDLIDRRTKDGGWKAMMGG